MQNACARKPLRGSTAMPDRVMLSICGDAKTTMAVSWRTDLSVAGGELIVRPEWGGEKETMRFAANTRRLTSDVDDSRRAGAGNALFLYRRRRNAPEPGGFV